MPGYPKNNLDLPQHLSFISAQRSGTPHDQAAHQNLSSELQVHGFKTHEVHGEYDGPEPSYMVEHDGSPESHRTIEAIGKKYGQESVLHSSSLEGTRHNKLVFVQSHQAPWTGTGYRHGPDISSYYTVLPSGHKIQMVVNQPKVQKNDLTDATKSYKDIFRQNWKHRTAQHKPHYYGVVDGIHVFHATHSTHDSLIGRHIHDPNDSELKATIDDVQSQGGHVVVIHGTPPESMRPTMHEQLGPQLAGKITKTESLEKMHDKFNVRAHGQPEMHGWISPQGQYHDIHPDMTHIHYIRHNKLVSLPERTHEDTDTDYNVVARQGWIGVGHGGSPSITMHENIMRDKPQAFHKLRQMVKEKWPHRESFELMLDRESGGTDIHQVDTNHFVRFGAIKTTEGKILKSELTKAFMHHDGETLTDPRAHMPAVGPLPETLMNWGSQKLSSMSKDGVEVIDLLGRTIKVRKLDTDLYNGWVEYQGANVHNFERLTMPELMSQLQSKLEMYGAEHKVNEMADPKQPEATPSESIKEKLADLKDKVSESVSISGKELMEGMLNPETECPECGQSSEKCLCFSHLPKPHIEFDYKAKKLTIMFKSEWSQEDRESFAEDLKRRVGLIIRKRYE